MANVQLGQANDGGFNGTGITAKSQGATLEGTNNYTSFSTAAVGVKGSGPYAGVQGLSDLYGVRGSAFSATGSGMVGTGWLGVAGYTYLDDWKAAGVYGQAHGSNATGVVGVANNGAQAYGVWGKSESGYAGYFSGKVRVKGALERAAGGFRIDHPVDPENRYLLHSSVESPEQLNVYSGTVVTGAERSAVVELPEYFEALNTDFRYQLTVIGDFAQAVVSEEVRDNRFTIGTDRPDVKVSWQVSGVRQDRYARANPVSVEQEKSEQERGKYLHPEAWQKPPTADVDYERIAAFENAKPKVEVLDPPTLK